MNENMLSEWLNLTVSKKVRGELRGAKAMTLGEILREITGHEASTLVFDVGGSPCKPHSYRGYYEMLAFEVGPDARSCRDVRAEMESCLGRTFEGYKGGDYMMDRNTIVWLAHYGTTSGARVIVGVDVRGDKVVLVTSEEPEF